MPSLPPRGSPLRGLRPGDRKILKKLLTNRRKHVIIDLSKEKKGKEMAEIKGYLLTEEEEKACANLVKKMREKKVYAIDFLGCVQIKAKNEEEAKNIFWNWVGDLQDKSLSDWFEIVTQTPYFEYDGIEQE